MPAAGVAVDWANPYAARVRAAMNDDFNTVEAMAVLFELAAKATTRARPSWLACC